MTSKKVISKRIVKKGRVTAAKGTQDFTFTREMIPVFSNGKPEAEFVSQFRKRAWEAYQELTLPNTSEEAWRRTDIRKLDLKALNLANDDSTEGEHIIPAELLRSLGADKPGGQVILSPSGSQIRLDTELAEQGVIFTDLATAAVKHPEVLEKILGKLVSVSDSKFAALTGAFAGSGVLLYVPKGVQVEQPLQSLYWGAGAALAHLSHILVWVEEQASVTFVHENSSPSEDGQSFHAGIVEMHVGRGANLRFIELQSWGENVWNFTHERARIHKDASLDWIFGAVGSRLTKNFSEIDLIGEGANGRMSGFYFTDGVQHLDHDTQQNHLAPHTSSDLLFKGALSGRSRSVWQGMIYVAPDAQKSDGYQSNPNLVLSKDARADSIPGLEILADDVRCTHGATVGKMDPDEIFYLQSRGISEEAAERLIIEGFFDPIIQRIPYQDLRARVQQSIVDKLK